MKKTASTVAELIMEQTPVGLGRERSEFQFQIWASKWPVAVCEGQTDPLWSAIYELACIDMYEYMSK